MNKPDRRIDDKATDITNRFYTRFHDLFPEEHPDRPLGKVSEYVCTQLREDIAKVENHTLSISEFEANINFMVQSISSNLIEILLLPKNSEERKVALLDLYLLQSALNNLSGIKSSDYKLKEMPTTPLEITIKLLADPDYDWHSMPWTLTGKDYPIYDVRRMFVDDSVAQSEKFLLAMQYAMERTFFEATKVLVNALREISNNKSVDECILRMQQIVILLQQNAELMTLLTQGIPEGHFDRYMTKYYPSGAFAIDVYLVEVMVNGRTETLMSRINDALVQRGKVDPDVLPFAEYVINPNNRIFTNIDLSQYAELEKVINSIQYYMKLFRIRHLGAATHHTEGHVEELKKRKAPLGNKPDALKSLKDIQD